MLFNKQINNITRIFHSAIIAIILSLSFNSCGYKTAPIYVPPKKEGNQTKKCSAIKNCKSKNNENRKF